ncbi:MAG: cysteine desulfurase family protein [Acidimicrobiales bacterium]
MAPLAAMPSMPGAEPRALLYLDNAAGTPLRPEVYEAMAPWLTTAFGNASAGHSMGRAARRAVDDARDDLAEVLGAGPAEVVFTSGGTEADNLAISGVAAAARERGLDRPVIGCSAVEHPAVLEPVRAAGGAVLPVGRDGIVDLERFEGWLCANPERVVEVSVMLVNNETGVIQPIELVERVTREVAPGALVHTDAVQALGWLDVSTLCAGADLVSVSAHKIGGPQGTGALVVRSRARSRVHPLLLGGPQEGELRAGTHDVAGVVGMARAARLCAEEREETSRRVTELAETLVAGVLRGVPGSAQAVPFDLRVGAICNIFFDGVVGEELLIVLDDLGVCASGGAACATGALEPSHVLLAMGRTPEEARSHVRLSLGYSSTARDVEVAVAALIEAVARLRV